MCPSKTGRLTLQFVLPLSSRARASNSFTRSLSNLAFGSFHFGEQGVFHGQVFGILIYYI